MSSLNVLLCIVFVLCGVSVVVLSVFRFIVIFCSFMVVSVSETVLG